MGSIAENYTRLRDSVKEEVSIIVATKKRKPEEIEEVIKAGATDIGENYAYPEAYNKYQILSDTADKVKWHLIGPLQKNKINKALPIFDVIQTVNSINLAENIDRRVRKFGKSIMSVLLEVNSGKEVSKSGFPPDFSILKNAVLEMENLEHILINGLMTMGPWFGDPADARPYFKLTRELFESLKDVKTSNSEMKILSMGMSNSYKVAIKEGSNMVRIGSLIFGPRE